MGLSIFDEVTPFIGGHRFLPADGTNWQQLWAQGFADVRLDAMPIISTAVANHVMRVKISDGATDYHIGALTVPAGAGMGTVANLDGMPLIQPAAIGGLVVPKGLILWAMLTVVLGAGEELPVTVLGGIL